MEELQENICIILCVIGFITIMGLTIFGLANMVDGISFNMYKDNYCATKFNNKTGIDKCKSKSVYKFMAEYLK